MPHHRDPRGDAETAADLIAGRERYAASGEINSTVNDPDAVLADIAARAEAGEFGAGDVDRFDGVSLQGADFWFNVRKSNTEPLVRFNCETPDPQRTRALTTAVLAPSAREAHPTDQTNHHGGGDPYAEHPRSPDSGRPPGRDLGRRRRPPSILAGADAGPHEPARGYAGVRPWPARVAGT